jgi:hypothetical protein
MVQAARLRFTHKTWHGFGSSHRNQRPTRRRLRTAYVRRHFCTWIFTKNSKPLLLLFDFLASRFVSIAQALLPAKSRKISALTIRIRSGQACEGSGPPRSSRSMQRIRAIILFRERSFYFKESLLDRRFSSGIGFERMHVGEGYTRRLETSLPLIHK